MDNQKQTSSSSRASDAIDSLFAGREERRRKLLENIRSVRESGIRPLDGSTIPSTSISLSRPSDTANAIVPGEQERTRKFLESLRRSRESDVLSSSNTMDSLNCEQSSLGILQLSAMSSVEDESLSEVLKSEKDSTAQMDDQFAKLFRPLSFHETMDNDITEQTIREHNPYVDMSSFRVEDLYAISMVDDQNETDPPIALENMSKHSKTSTPKKLNVDIHNMEYCCELPSENCLRIVSDDEFFSADEGLKMIDKDEQSFKEMKKFEIAANQSNWETSVSSNFSSFSKTDMSGILPGDFSFGQYFSKGTEYLGNLNDESQKARVSYGIPVSSPKNSQSETEYPSSVASDFSNSDRKLTIASHVSEVMSSLHTADSPATLSKKVLSAFKKDEVESNSAAKTFSVDKTASSTYSMPLHDLEDVSSSTAASNLNQKSYSVSSQCSGGESLGSAPLWSMTQTFPNTTKPEASVQPVMFNFCNLPHVTQPTCIPSNLIQIPTAYSFQHVLPSADVISHVHSRPLSGFISLSPKSVKTEPMVVCKGVERKISLTLENKSDTTVFCHLRIIFVFRNDFSSPVDEFSIPDLAPIQQNNKFYFEANFIPVRDGNVEAHLKIVPSLSPKYESSGYDSIVEKLHFFVEEPKVSLLFQSKREMSWGDICEHGIINNNLTVINSGKAAVPISIAVLGNIEPHCLKFLSFEENERPKRMSNLTLVVHGSLEQSRGNLNLPLVFQAQNCTRERDDVSGTIKALLDGFVKEPVASIDFNASVGKIKIMLKRPFQNPLKLTNQNTDSKLGITNRGTISTEVQLTVTSNCFTVDPSVIKILPNTDAEITVSFTPIDAEPAQGLLLGTPIPCGNAFKLLNIVGEIVRSRTTENAFGDLRREQNKVIIQSNKRQLVWGCVDAGESVTKTIVMRNPTTELLNAKAVVKGSEHQAFLIIDPINKRRKLSMNLVFEPNASVSLSVAFSPLEVSNCIGCLCVYLETEGKFQVPLSGYGGISKLKILHLPADKKTGYTLPLSNSGLSFSHQEVTLRNTGCRPAFVKIVTNIDSTSSECIVEPTEFVVLDRETKTISVHFNMKGKLDVFGKLGTMSIVSSEEILRQNWKRVNPKSLQYSFKDIDFQVSFLGEERVPIDEMHKSSSYDERLFFASLRTLNVELTMEDQSSMSFASLTLMQETMIAPCDAVQTIPSLPPPPKQAKDEKGDIIELSPQTCDMEIKPLSVSPDYLPGEHGTKMFSVEPHSVTLDCYNKTAQLVLSNHGFVELRFKIDYSATFICVSPGQGVVPPRSSIGLRINFVAYSPMTCYTDDAFIKVSGNGGEQIVPVKINESLMNPKLSLESNDQETSGNDTVLEKTVVVSESPGISAVHNGAISSVASTLIEKTEEPSSSETKSALMPDSKKLLLAASESKVHEVRHLESRIPLKTDNETGARRKQIKKKEPLIVEKTTVKFPVTAVNASVLERITLKNISTENIEVSISDVPQPFKLNHRKVTVKARVFLKVSVVFHPQSKGTYNCTLILKPQNQKEIEIHLEGMCK